MTKDWVHIVGHSPICQILLQIVVSGDYVLSTCLNQFCWDVVNSSWLPFLQWLYCSLHFFAKDGVVILCVCLGTVQYWWISIGLVIVQGTRPFCCARQQTLVFVVVVVLWKSACAYQIYFLGQDQSTVAQWPEMTVSSIPWWVAYELVSLIWSHTMPGLHNQPTPTSLYHGCMHV